MLEKWNRLRRLALALCLCLLALGAVMVIWPDISVNVVCLLLGILCTAAGIYQIVRYFQLGFVGVFFRFDLTLGILGVVAGVFLLTHPQGARALLPVAVGVYMLLSGIFTVQTAVELRRFGSGSWGGELALGIIDSLFALALILDPFQGADTLMIFLGISLVIDGIQGLGAVHYCTGAVRKLLQDTDVIDVDWESV